MSSRATPRKPRARSQGRIDTILDAARTLLAAQGVASLSIYSVAQRAGIAPSSVYHFFPSVPALLQALTSDVHAAFRACLQVPVAHGELTGWRDLSRIIEQRMLTTFADLPHTGKAHRAMADAEMAANLTAHLAEQLRQKHGLRELNHDLLCSLQKVPAAKINEHLKRYRGF